MIKGHCTIEMTLVKNIAINTNIKRGDEGSTNSEIPADVGIVNMSVFSSKLHNEHSFKKLTLTLTRKLTYVIIIPMHAIYMENKTNYFWYTTPVK